MSFALPRPAQVSYDPDYTTPPATKLVAKAQGGDQLIYADGLVLDGGGGGGGQASASQAVRFPPWRPPFTLARARASCHLRCWRKACMTNQPRPRLLPWRTAHPVPFLYLHLRPRGQTHMCTGWCAATGDHASPRSRPSNTPPSQRYAPFRTGPLLFLFPNDPISARACLGNAFSVAEEGLYKIVP